MPTFLLSSNTVFMFSIQTASTGPSNTIHFLSSDVLAACSLNVFAKIPEKIFLSLYKENKANVKSLLKFNRLGQNNQTTQYTKSDCNVEKFQ